MISEEEASCTAIQGAFSCLVKLVGVGVFTEAGFFVSLTQRVSARGLRIWATL